jgi:hypothetical protein
LNRDRVPEDDFDSSEDTDEMEDFLSLLLSRLGIFVAVGFLAFAAALTVAATAVVAEMILCMSMSDFLTDGLSLSSAQLVSML